MFVSYYELLGGLKNDKIRIALLFDFSMNCFKLINETMFDFRY